jgi:transposase
MREEIFNMTPMEMTRLRVINQIIDKVISIREAAELLNLSERQVMRLKKGVREQGPGFIIHKNRGRKPSHAISEETRSTIVELKKSKYKEANFKHFQELLEEYENISISYPSVYRILSQAGITSPKKHKEPKAHHRRKRKPQEGMLVQIDASPHTWIIGGEPFSLHGAIDDATGKVLALFFAKNECLEGHFNIMEQIITQYGLPVSIYCDRHTIFISPKNGKLSIEEQLQGKQVNLTQFGRAMQELGISVIPAKSPQAKGRIERLWETLQSRLPVEFKIAEINTMEAANAFLSQFMERYNNRFAVQPENPVSAFRPLDKGIDLDTTLCIKEERVIIEGGAFSYRGKYYQLVTKSKGIAVLPKAKITVLDNPKRGIRAMYKGEVFETIMLEERPKKSAPKSKPSKKERVYSKPSANHPWRKGFTKKPKLYYEETDSEILEILDELFSSTRAWV